MLLFKANIVFSFLNPSIFYSLKSFKLKTKYEKTNCSNQYDT